MTRRLDLESTPRKTLLNLSRVLVGSSVVLFSGSGWSQTTPAAGPAPATAVVAPAAQPGSAVVPAGAFGFPQAGNGTIGGGNATESSAHPVTGDQEDTFDFGVKAPGGASMHGSEGGPIYLSSRRPPLIGEAPESYVVRRGDTLWGICDQYLRNPYEWPRVWSFNPDMKNPNWIYPGDELRLREASATGDASHGATSASNGPQRPETQTLGGLVDRHHGTAKDTVFLRDQGWIGDGSDEVWGEITGAAQDKMFLSVLDEIYVRIDKGHTVRLGQELTIFSPIRASTSGTIVKIEGTARVNQYSETDRMARAQIVESLNVIERGAKIGPLARSFEVVPVVRDSVNVQARVLASVYPNEFFGQNQVIFIDIGAASGIVPGNRLAIIRRGDAWRSTLIAPIAGYRVSPDDDKPMPPMENTPGLRKDDAQFPEERIADLRVVSTHKDTSTCIVTQARAEIEIGDRVVGRKGY